MSFSEKRILIVKNTSKSVENCVELEKRGNFMSKVENIEEIISGASEQAQETLLNALSHYNRLSKKDDLELGDLSRIVTGTNSAIERLKVEGIGYDRQLPPRVETERITGMDVPLVRLKDDIWTKI